MPIIIDANRTGDFSRPVTDLAAEILKRVEKKHMRVCVGGKLTSELNKTKLVSLLLEWSRNGQLYRANDKEVDEEENALIGKIVSDDPHVVALARILNCRLLFTCDNALIQDFKNTKLISPKGKVVRPTTSKKVSSFLFDRLGA